MLARCEFSQCRLVSNNEILSDPIRTQEFLSRLRFGPAETNQHQLGIDWKTVRVLWLLGYRESWLSNLGFIPFKIGTLRSGNGDAYENVAEK